MNQHLCERVVDEDNHVSCGERAYDTLFVKTTAGQIMRVWVCAKHFSEHNRKAAEKRVARK